MPALAELHSVQSDEFPSPQAALTELNHALTDVSEWLGEQQRGEQDQLCLWEGQSPDYRRWDKVVGKPVAPWDGCADTRVRLIDANVDELVMLKMTAFFQANPSAVQQESNDASSASKVQTLLKYEVRQRMKAELWREMNFVATWMEQFGYAVMETRWAQGWKTTQETITPDQLAEWLAMQQAEQMQALGQVQSSEEVLPVLMDDAQLTVGQMLTDTDKDAAVELLRQRYPTLTERRAGKVVNQLRQGEAATFRLPVRCPGRPQVIARCPGVDYFSPWWRSQSNGVAWEMVVDSLTEVELRQKVLTEGWDESFVDQMLTLGPVQAVDQASLATQRALHTSPRAMFDNQNMRKLRRRIEELRNCYQVLRFFIKSVDEDGVMCAHEMVCHPSIMDAENPNVPLVAKVTVHEDWLDRGNFTEFRRQFKTRSLWECQTVPELTGGYQWELKKFRDGLINRNDLAVSPPTRTTTKNAAGKGERLGIRPGSVIREERGQESDWMTPPQLDAAALDMEERIRAGNANLLGLYHDAVPQAKTMMHQGYMVTNWLVQCREVLLKVLALDQQFMDPLAVTRVIGNGPLPFMVTREEIAGQFDVTLEFDVRMLDMEYVKERWNVIKEAYANDRSGVMNDEVITRWLISSIDPTLADTAIGDATEVAKREAEDEKVQLAVAAMDVVLQPKEGGNAQSRLRAIDEELTQNQKLRGLYLSDPNYRAIVDARRAKYEFDVQQRKNAGTGRTGWEAPELNEEQPQSVLPAA